ncbi:deSI-like protein At4g17486 isoform X1 [Arachis hypogaea]|uniref:deSI-like protein At4g17486 isoform X1 n=1 Tax=Arachis hypogaea TaxID=3818 RepID=UPI000DECAC2E|nr:deSI-like protein At4g17486 isoform X1 [Arachis hypogaea]XP_025701214.1 deSI-like protein At4g17486 isoform X1 [Arachis hypogaea]XP_025701229.1 deSI-like protein At4g17486 isoform X1 [Arachis hypogaea]XP_025701237.1 deSI-like protein At4g17486 isoform X1 [Arachis hypogaea]
MPMFPLSMSSERVQDNNERRNTMVYLNVYDLTPVNNYLYAFGVGIYHSGIEVHGMEYGFGAHDYSTSGVFEVEPRSCPGFIFRRSVLLGTTDMSRSEFRTFIEHLSSKYHGDTYHLIAKNCNHFTDEVCQQLTGKPIPAWVNRLARVVSGSFCNCLLPESLQVAAVRHLPEHLACSDDERSDSDWLSGSSDDDNDDDDDDERSNRQLLNSPNGDISLIQEAPMTLARDALR